MNVSHVFDSCEFSFQIEVVEDPDEDATDFDLNEVLIQVGIDVSFVYGPLLAAVVDLGIFQESETFPGSADQPLPTESSSSQSNSTVGLNTIDGLVTTYWKKSCQRYD